MGIKDHIANVEGIIMEQSCEDFMAFVEVEKGVRIARRKLQVHAKVEKKLNGEEGLSK